MNKNILQASLPVRRSQHGFTMIEVLITLVVLAIGLLATAQLQALSLQRNNEALFRTQATNLSYEILDQLRASRRVVVGGAPSSTQTARFQQLVADRLPNGTVTVAIANDLVTITVTWLDDRTKAPPPSGPDPRELAFVLGSRI